MTDRESMARALALAWRGWGRVGANPLVGAVVVRDGAVLGEGWHAEFGGAHAEVKALQDAGRRSAGADLYCTLEPCAHHGKTPPCTDAIVRAGIRRVVFAAADVDPAARGGAERLRSAGIAVESGLLADDARAQNAHFFHRHAGSGRPFVACKLALSLDGRIADGHRQSRWIGGEASRAWVHWLRAGHDAIGVGLGTVLADDPRLTVRGALVPPRPPLRVVFDMRAETPLDSALVATARDVPTVVLAGTGAPASRVRALDAAGAAVERAEGFPGWLSALYRRGVDSLLVEGGGVLAGRLVAAGLVDRLYLISAPLLLGRDGIPAFGDAVTGVRLEDVQRWRAVGRKALDDDTLTVLDRPA